METLSSKYRKNLTKIILRRLPTPLRLVAAQRSKQLQRGARPRVDMDIQHHKPTRIALQEVKQGKIDFDILEIKI
jgi:DNA-directed RNA polymerase omega subunit